MSSWEELSELLIVTLFVTGTLSFSHMMSGSGDACKGNIRNIEYKRPGVITAPLI